MEPAIQDLVRELDDRGQPRQRVPEVEVEVELEVIDDLMLDPWFFKTEEEIAAIEDDPTAKIIEIKLDDYASLTALGTELPALRWAV